MPVVDWDHSGSGLARFRPSKRDTDEEPGKGEGKRQRGNAREGKGEGKIASGGSARQPLPLLWQYSGSGPCPDLTQQRGPKEKRRQRR